MRLCKSYEHNTTEAPVLPYKPDGHDKQLLSYRASQVGIIRRRDCLILCKTRGHKVSKSFCDLMKYNDNIVTEYLRALFPATLIL